MDDFSRKNAFWRSPQNVWAVRVLWINPIGDWLAEVIDFDAANYAVLIAVACQVLIFVRR
jgi:hypothetical protein